MTLIIFFAQAATNVFAPSLLVRCNAFFTRTTAIGRRLLQLRTSGITHSFNFEINQSNYFQDYFIVQQMYKTNQSPTLGPIYKPAITQPHQQLQSATFNQKVTQFNNSPSRPQISSIQRASSKMTSYSPMVKTAQSSRATTQNIYSPQKKEETVAYGFGANGRVHPDVVKSPISQLKSQVAGGLPGIRSGIKGRGQISDM
ncbi:Dual_specificity protein phosphatase CDC14A [Hexamita inflata]|uniref:Dual specificity protein phosphatase CDC14A n=1 Tax=Hexamita inflata TaxID=28002 RepID=A0AA86UZM7_9EUKA|nr:Dual specificity protein phosphatase CDC14A [Hexamita inflata]